MAVGRKESERHGLLAKARQRQLQIKLNQRKIFASRYRNLFDHSNDAIFIHDLDGKIIDVNKRALKLFEYRKTELLKLNIKDIHPPYTWEKSAEAFAQIQKTGAIEFEIDFQKKSGQTFTAEVSSSIFKVGKQKIVQGIVRDVSERKRMEEQLRSSQRQLHSIIRAVPDIIYRVDKHSRITFISDSIREYGYDPAELIGKNIFELIHPDDWERARYRVNERRTGDRRTRYFEIRLKTRNHKYVPFDIHARGLYEEPVFLLEAEGLYSTDKPQSNSFIGSQGIARDITERKIAEKVLIESEKKLNAILSSMVDTVLLFNEQGTIMSAYVHQNGFSISPDTVVGKKFNEVLPEHTHQKFQEILDLNKDGIIAEYEFCLGTDDKKVWYSAKVSPTFQKEHYSGSVAVIREITGRKQAEDTLKLKIKQSEMLLETARHISASLNLKEVLTQIAIRAKTILNASSCVIYTLSDHGQKLQPVVNLNSDMVTKTTPSFSVEENCTNLAIKARKGMIFNPHELKNGKCQSSTESSSDLQNVIAAPFILQESVLGAMCLIRSGSLFSQEDLSLAETFASYAAIALRNAQAHQELQREVKERLQAEKSRYESEERYRQFFEEDLTGDYISTADGRLIACNPAFLKIFGFTSREEALATNVVSLYPDPADRQKFLNLLKEKQKLEYHQMELRRRDGRTVYIIANMAGKFDEKGNLTEIKGYLFDNTQQKLLEEQFRQAQKMEAIGRLAGGVAHDFNNLLTIINGYSDLILHRLPADDALIKDIKQIKQAGEKASRLTNQLLAFSRRQLLQPKLINLNTIVMDINKMLRRLIGEDIELILILDPNLGVIKADPGQIEQVIMNLAVNARDAMPNGGKLTIETANTLLEKDYLHKNIPVQPAGNYVTLSVTDTGKGMDEETLGHIFEPFFTTKEHGKGTGLGLSTVYGIVKQSEGFIWVDSEMGKGSTFKIYFPRIWEQISQVSAPPRTNKSLEGKETILLVEDEQMVRELATRILTEKGYQVLQASRGETALEISKNYGQTIDLMITDIVMPGISGKKLAAEIKKDRPNLKVLYISGYTNEIPTHQNFIEEQLDFLQKPFLPEKFLSQVREILDN